MSQLIGDPCAFLGALSQEREALKRANEVSGSGLNVMLPSNCVLPAQSHRLIKCAKKNIK